MQAAAYMACWLLRCSTRPRNATSGRYRSRNPSYSSGWVPEGQARTRAVTASESSHAAIEEGDSGHRGHAVDDAEEDRDVEVPGGIFGTSGTAPSAGFGPWTPVCILWSSSRPNPHVREYSLGQGLSVASRVARP